MLAEQLGDTNGLPCLILGRRLFCLCLGQRSASVGEVLPRHQVSTMDRTLQGEDGEKGVRTCSAATVEEPNHDM